jgi:hypothetical protein
VIIGLFNGFISRAEIYRNAQNGNIFMGSIRALASSLNRHDYFSYYSELNLERLRKTTDI